MSRSSIAKVSPLVVAIGETTSRTVRRSEFSDAIAVMVYAPASLQGAITRSYQTSYDGITWHTLTDSGGSITLPVVGASRHHYEMLAALFWRIAYSVAPEADEVWRLSKQWSI